MWPMVAMVAGSLLSSYLQNKGAGAASAQAPPLQPISTGQASNVNPMVLQSLYGNGQQPQFRSLLGQYMR